jgi:hypothetical protein
MPRISEVARAHVPSVLGLVGVESDFGIGFAARTAVAVEARTVAAGAHIAPAERSSAEGHIDAGGPTGEAPGGHTSAVVGARRKSNCQPLSRWFGGD